MSEEKQARESYISSTRTAKSIDYQYYDKDSVVFPSSASFSVASSSRPSHVGLIDYYLPKFDTMARGRMANKYHIAFYGPYVEQALLIMARNSRNDKYQTNELKTFVNETASFERFKEWVKMFFIPETAMLNMYWAASSVQIGEAKAEIESVSMDTVKGMSYPVIKGIQSGTSNTLSITVVDDPFMMWYQFFNALFNTQFTPLVLKPTSSFEKINIMINEYAEMTTTGETHQDLALGQMFEFNSCVMNSAPKTSMSFANGKPAEYTLTFTYPNAFQGSFKNKLRYMIDWTTAGNDKVTIGQNSTEGKMWTYYTNYDQSEFEFSPFDKGSPNEYSAYRLLENGKSPDLPAPVPQLGSVVKRGASTVGWNGVKWTMT